MRTPEDILVVEQLCLGTAVRSALDERVAKFLGLARSVVAALEKRQGLDLAAEAGKDPAEFSRALHGKVALGVKPLLVLLWRDKTRALIQFLCAACGGDFVERPKETPEQRLALYEKRLSELAKTETGAAIARAIRGEDEP